MVQRVRHIEGISEAPAALGVRTQWAKYGNVVRRLRTPWYGWVNGRCRGSDPLRFFGSLVWFGWLSTLILLFTPSPLGRPPFRLYVYVVLCFCFCIASSSSPSAPRPFSAPLQSRVSTPFPILPARSRTQHQRRILAPHHTISHRCPFDGKSLDVFSLTSPASHILRSPKTPASPSSPSHQAPKEIQRKLSGLTSPAAETTIPPHPN